MTDNQFGAILEDIDHKFDVVVESLSFMASAAQVEELKIRMHSMESGFEFVRRLLARHDQRLEEQGKTLLTHDEYIERFEALRIAYENRTS